MAVAGREISCLEDLEDICSLDSDDAKESLFVTLWLLNMSSLTLCTEIIFNSSPAIQPCAQLIDTEFRLCAYHCSLLSNDLIGAHYESLHCFKCDGQKLEELGLLPSKKDRPLQATASFPQPIVLYFSRHFLSESLSLQALNLKRSAEMDAREAAFLNRLDSGCKTVSVYEDPLQQYSARNIIPYALIHTYAVEYLTEFPNTAEDEACLRGNILLFVYHPK